MRIKRKKLVNNNGLERFGKKWLNKYEKNLISYIDIFPIDFW